MLTLTRTRKPVKLSNNDKAAQRLTTLLVSGRTLTIPAAWGYVTVGAYTPAVGAGGFAVYGYRKLSPFAAAPAFSRHAVRQSNLCNYIRDST